MSSNRKIFLILGIVLLLLVSRTPSLGAQHFRIINAAYDTHFLPGERVLFSFEVHNGTGAAQNVYINVVLTNFATGQEVLPYPTVPAFALAPGNTMSRTTTLNNWNAVEGLYTVTAILYGAGDIELHRIHGSVAIEVGTLEESVSAFPNIIDLGVLPYGRYMYPTPIRIHYSFFHRNRMRRAQPWYMRIYTDNSTRYTGIEGAVYRARRAISTSKKRAGSGAEGSPAGLVSSDGRYAIPLRVWCLNYGPDWDEIGWNPTLLGPPPVNEDYVWKGPELDDGTRDADRRVWLWVPDYIDMTADQRTWRNLIGRDPYNNNYVTDNNPTGDFTLTSPFDIYLATETSPVTVVGKYSGKLVIELYTP